MRPDVLSRRGAALRNDPNAIEMPPDVNLIVHEVISYVVPGLVVMVLGFPVVRLITKWLEPKPVPPRVLSTMDGRLERIEAAVDAIALEVERISEAQRFTARLQSEQASPRLPSGNPTPRT
jgi:hypothetical protein